MEENYIRKKSTRERDRPSDVSLQGWRGVVSFPILDQFPFLINGFSTRQGGVSKGDGGSMNLSLAREVAMNMHLSEAQCRANFLENHRRFAGAVGYPYEALVFSNQTHTDNIRVLQEIDRGNGITRPNEFNDVDGLMTDITGQALMTFYADCVPLLIVDPVHRAIASVHSGWRGTIKGIRSQGCSDDACCLWFIAQRSGCRDRSVHLHGLLRGEPECRGGLLGEVRYFPS